jgi:thimet oligopeptidase
MEVKGEVSGGDMMKSHRMQGGGRVRRLSRLLLSAAITLMPLSRIGLGQAPGHSPASQPAPVLHFDHVTEAEMNAVVDYAIAEARGALERIIAAPGRRTVDNTLRPYDDVRIGLNAARMVEFFANNHPDRDVRVAAIQPTRRFREFNDAIRLDPRLYNAIAEIDASHADDTTRFYIDRELATFRAAGVELDSARRAKLARLRSETSRLEQQFLANLRADTTALVIKDASTLEGAPPDWLAAQARGPAGEIIVKRNATPVLQYAKDHDVRQRALLFLFNVAAPTNRFLLDTLLQVRSQLATVLGYHSFAEYDLARNMARSPENVRAFLDQLDHLLEPAVRRGFAQELALLRREHPDAKGIAVADAPYLLRSIRAENAGTDPAALREYFPYAQVRDAIFRVSGTLFGVEFRRVTNAPAWHPSVEVYDAFDAGHLIGRVYLDTHHALGSDRAGGTAPLRTGVRGRVLPEAVLRIGFGGERVDDPALMSPTAAGTFFHEFGHVLHHLLSGAAQPWFGTSGWDAEFDFREAPAIALELIGTNPSVVQTYARHYRTGAPLPPSLLAALEQADRLNGGAFEIKALLWRSRMSLELHDQRSARVNIDSIVRATYRATLPFEFPDDEVHPEASFMHLSGYASAYYTYPWSQVIAADLVSRFGSNPLDPRVGREFRRAILEAGRSKPSARQIEAFLGRPFQTTAWAKSIK